MTTKTLPKEPLKKELLKTVHVTELSPKGKPRPTWIGITVAYRENVKGLGSKEYLVQSDYYAKWVSSAFIKWDL